MKNEKKTKGGGGVWGSVRLRLTFWRCEGQLMKLFAEEKNVPAKAW